MDLEKAVSRTTYDVGQTTYTREALASLADRVIVLRLTANKAGSISFTANYSSPQQQKAFAVTPSKDLLITGTTSDHEGVKGLVAFQGITRIKLEGGSLTSTDTSLIVKGANSATIFISIATNFNTYQDISGDAEKRAIDYLNHAFPKTYPAILTAHIAAYQKYFKRVNLDLGTTPAARCQHR